MSLQYDREELYQKVWEKPLLRVAEQYGVSAVALGKVCGKLGSERESGKTCILSGFPERDEFGLSGGQALSLQEQVIEITVAPTTAQQRFDVSIHGFHNPQRHLDFAVVQDSFQMVE
jgi:hypothetical protein